jgi:hypothetical protein
MRMRRQGHRDFLIGEEPLEGEVGFFASSVDADPPAAADTVAETTLGAATGFLPTGRASERGSARTRRLALTVVLAAVGALAAIVAASVPSADDRPLPRRDEQSVRVERGGVGGEQGERSLIQARRARRDGVPPTDPPQTPTRRTASRDPVSAQLQPTVAAPLPVEPPTAPTSLGPATSSLATGPAPGIPRGEFEFER